MKYDEHKTVDGWTDWIRPVMDDYRIACCDCGLVHEFVFRVVTDEDNAQRVEFRARRNNRATAAKRRYARKA